MQQLEADGKDYRRYNLTEVRGMEKEFLKKAKEVGFPQELIELGLDHIKILKEAGLEYTVEQIINYLRDVWKYMPIY